jgi:tetratricopeptide (TPR) repeat protein
MPMLIITGGLARYDRADQGGALDDYTKAIHLKPNFASAYYNRGIVLQARGDLDGALKDYTEAIRLRSDYANAYGNRGIVWKKKANFPLAIADYKKYLELGGGKKNGDQAQIKESIRDLKKKIK